MARTIGPRPNRPNKPGGLSAAQTGPFLGARPAPARRALRAAMAHGMPLRRRYLRAPPPPPPRNPSRHHSHSPYPSRPMSFTLSRYRRPGARDEETVYVGDDVVLCAVIEAHGFFKIREPGHKFSCSAIVPLPHAAVPCVLLAFVSTDGSSFGRGTRAVPFQLVDRETQPWGDCS
ncbi:hypothetical protein Cni_G00941 [Canna indica]|uniref:Uncharacterized protein n=1 Tax=Canna indica TaxID=4628 RepID=A0AAQ3PXH6_9LILI|nr:hypothetical protein Cni_G00941 [Canna indica]